MVRARRLVKVSFRSPARYPATAATATRWFGRCHAGGNPVAFRDLLRTMHHGGKVALLGIPPVETAIDWNEVIFKGLILKGIYGREMFETWYKMSSMLQSGLDIRAVITHRFPLEDYEEAFGLMESGQSGKIILSWE